MSNGERFKKKSAALSKQDAAAHGARLVYALAPRFAIGQSLVMWPQFFFPTQTTGAKKKKKKKKGDKSVYVLI